MTQPLSDTLTWLPLFSLTIARCAGMVCLAAPLNWRPVPVWLRLAVAGVLAVPLALSLPQTVFAVSGPPYAALLARELAVGALLGWGLWLLVSAAAAAGHLMDPAPEGSERPLSAFMVIVTLVFFVQLDGLPWLVCTLRESYNLLPLQAPLRPLSDWHAVVYLPSRMFIIMLSLAAPVVLSVILASALLAAVQRCLPALHSAQLLPPARYLTTLLALMVIAPLLGMFVLGEMTGAVRAATSLLAGVARP